MRRPFVCWRKLHQHSWPQDIDAAEGYSHHIHNFDRDAMMIEVELLSDWYVPRMQRQSRWIRDKKRNTSLPGIKYLAN